MPRTSSITAVALAAALSLPAAAFADGATDADAARLLADATPMTDAPVPRDAPELTDTPIASRNGELLADSGDPERLLAQAPTATATPPASSLPRTGPEVLLTLAAGGGLMLAGAGLRLGAARPRLRVALSTADGPR